MDNTQRLGIELRRLFLDTTTDNNADVLAVYDRGYKHGYKAAKKLDRGEPVSLTDIKVGDQVLITGTSGEQFIFTVDGVTSNWVESKNNYFTKEHIEGVYLLNRPNPDAELLLRIVEILDAGVVTCTTNEKIAADLLSAIREGEAK